MMARRMYWEERREGIQAKDSPPAVRGREAAAATASCAAVVERNFGATPSPLLRSAPK
jgi:hypothetical protein